MKDFEKKVVKYTVSLNNLETGTITAVELPEIKVGDDKCGNYMGINGTITKIKNIKIIG